MLLHKVQLNLIERPLPIAPFVWIGARVGPELAVCLVTHLGIEGRVLQTSLVSAESGQPNPSK